MSDVNEVKISGYVTKIETKQTKKGNDFYLFTLESFPSHDSPPNKISCVRFGKLGGSAKNSGMEEGVRIEATGSITSRDWTSPAGKTMTFMQFSVSDVRVMDTTHAPLVNEVFNQEPTALPSGPLDSIPF